MQAHTGNYDAVFTVCVRHKFLFRWRTEAFTPCSRTCDGTQTRRVYCSCDFPNATSAGEAPDAVCEATAIALKPIANRSCGEECETYSWSVGEWGTCSAECGPGIERRTVTCEKATLSSTTTVDNSECDESIGFKPDSSRDCRRECQIVASNWSTCSVDAGCGHQTRTLVCVQVLSNDTRNNVSFTHCQYGAFQSNESLPAERRQCQCSYRYGASAWSPCSVTCDAGFQYSQVTCVRVHSFSNTETVVNDSYCIHLLSSKPKNRRHCSRTCGK